ncbi:MAG: hypothetical protein PHR92_15870 [Lachnospiraceae bacterium]|nr:hypothetical protein [Lachnospiraceae bacterium]
MSRRKWNIAAILALVIVLMTGVGQCKANTRDGDFDYRYASMEEGKKLLLGNTAYYAGYSQDDLDYRMQKQGATMEEYQAYAAAQVLEISQDEKAVIDAHMANMEKTMADQGYTLPAMEQIVFVKTTQNEEGGSVAYTHGTCIFLGDGLMELLASEDEAAASYAECILWHEIFHCLTRCSPEFRASMYSVIHFTVQQENFELPPSVSDYFISNPDVENHNAYATFLINGKPVDCFIAFIVTQHFEQQGESFFQHGIPVLVPTDGSDVYYTKAQASNFDEIFGENTGYVVDPEECLADNFSFAMTYGLQGENGGGYSNPEMIEAILKYVSNQ